MYPLGAEGVAQAGGAMGRGKEGCAKLGGAKLAGVKVDAAKLEGAKTGARVGRGVALPCEGRVEGGTWDVARGGSCTSSRRQLMALLNLAQSSSMRL